MIKFFRKIRYDLMKQNKVSKYFKYAIGEIILVVLGILIALSINNWNESRKVQKNEITILEQLNADLKENLEELFEIDSVLTQSVDASENFLLFLNSNNNTDSIATWLKDLGRNPIFNNANTAYKNLENNPNKIISNDSLRLRITLMYEQEFRNIDVRENVDKTHRHPEFSKQQRENFTITTELSGDGKEILFNYHKPKNILSLKENDSFKNALIDLHNFRKFRINILTSSENKLKLLIKDIDQEIERLK